MSIEFICWERRRRSDALDAFTARNKSSKPAGTLTQMFSKLMVAAGKPRTVLS